MFDYFFSMCDLIKVLGYMLPFSAISSSSDLHVAAVLKEIKTDLRGPKLFCLSVSTRLDFLLYFFNTFLQALITG